MKFLLLFFAVLAVHTIAYAKNPIIPNKGANDPHIRIINGRAYLSASHDKSIDSKQFIMEDWWLWSSDDLVNWKLESVLKPEETYIGKPFDGCWATDIAKRNGKYYWYFSEKNEQSGVMVSNSPSGPWKDPLGKPLLSAEMTPTHEYDMGIFEDKKGDFYIVFGVWDYYIAKLNEDMISLAEAPRKIEIKNPCGPYNPDGKNVEKPTDDKPFLHTFNGKFYLSWGCFYAMADNVYGPYDYKGTIIEQESFAPGFDTPTWPTGFKQGRHGSFFEWHNQWYFAYCDISQTGNRYFRDTFISYVHYKPNGEMALIRVDGIGVGEYDANNGKIEAEDYFKASGLSKLETAGSEFAIADIENNDYLIFPNIKGLSAKSAIEFKVTRNQPATIEIRKDSPKGELLASCKIEEGKSVTGFGSVSCSLPKMPEKQNLCFVFKGNGSNLFQLNSFQLIEEEEPHGGLTLKELSDFKKTKDEIISKNPQQLQEFEKLIIKADKLLDKAPYSVMNKKRMPPSNDKHDYLSLAPYFWPNPDTSNGLPYIRKDGEVNPETRDAWTDYAELSGFFNAVDVLGKAFFYSEKDIYADKAIFFINTWFLNPETLMNPNLNFGQGVPGTSTGRPFGIIEFSGIREVITCMDFLELGGKLDSKTKEGFQLWLKNYANWLQTSEIGISERNTLNNHGNWYDVQLCSILLYIGDFESVKEILVLAKTNRIAKQIQPDGSQPMELERTKSFSYSTMNLSAMTKLAWFGKRTGVDLWNFETADGRSIKKAYDFLIPYISSDKEWKYKQLGNLEEVKTSFVNLLMEAGKTFNEENYVSIAKQHQVSKSGQTPELH
jgi:hypothetical protein